MYDNLFSKLIPRCLKEIKYIQVIIIQLHFKVTAKAKHFHQVNQIIFLPYKLCFTVIVAMNCILRHSHCRDISIFRALAQQIKTKAL